MIGLGKISASGTSAASPTNHTHGAIAAIARPPSSGTTGSRLNRFKKKPVNASARQQDYYSVRPVDRALVAGVYLSLIALLVVGMHATALTRTFT